MLRLLGAAGGDDVAAREARRSEMSLERRAGGGWRWSVGPVRTLVTSQGEGHL